MNRPSIRFARSIGCAVMLGLLLAAPQGCKRSQPDSKARGEKKPGSSRPAQPASTRTPQSDAALLGKIEALTGTHAKIVWSECQNPKKPDPFSLYEDQVLKGLDTHDPRGERAILAERGNYSRPLLTTDGNTILYTKKGIIRKGGRYHFDLTIFRTDWTGVKPVPVGAGYAVDTWRDPATGREWIIAVTDVGPQRERTFNAGKLVRFPLDDPPKIEILREEGGLSPDNIQLSRDGRSACALLPWPDAGLLHFENGSVSSKKYFQGCWTSHTPDNSGVFWVFDGEHKSTVMFTADGAKSWPLPLNDAPQFRRGEVYHPRWTNHPRFIVLTGPYSRKGGISGGGRSAQVNLGRLSPKLDKVEEWVQITDDDLGEAFPDAWIEGGDKVELAGFGSTTGKEKIASTTGKWPANPAGLLFLWKDHASMNSFRDASGGLHTAQLEAHGAARTGRHHEMALDGGWFSIAGESESRVLAALKSKVESAFEAIVILPEHPPREDNGASLLLFHTPSLKVSIARSSLATINDRRVLAALPSKPFHLAVSRADGNLRVWIDGKEAPIEKLGDLKDPALQFSNPNFVRFGDEKWSGGLLRIALYDRALSDEEIAANAASAREILAGFPPAPPRVKLVGKLVEASAVPSLESIEPYTSSLVTCVYDVEKVVSGDFKNKRVLVKHWGLLNRLPTTAFPRKIGQTYDLTLERELDHPELKGARVVDDTGVFDLEAWLDVWPWGVVSLPKSSDQ